MLQSEELLSLLEDFYTLTGIRIVLFDEKYREICSCPAGGDTLCACLRKNPNFDRKCRACDTACFENLRQQDSVIVYRCHAGLTEASVPILRTGRIVGYLMFGQITDETNRERFTEQMTAVCRQYGITDIPENRIQKVKCKTERQILAAAKILEAVAGYTILKDMIRSSGPIAERIEGFIDSHLGDELNADVICRRFGISRSGLYKLMKPYCADGIAGLIKDKRLARAKELIETTDRPIADISQSVGFSDYNYFLRIFKEKYGHSSRYYRKEQSSIG